MLNALNIALAHVRCMHANRAHLKNAELQPTHVRNSSPCLKAREDWVLKQFRRERFQEVKFVECANTLDLEALNTSQFRCVHPWVLPQHTNWPRLHYQFINGTMPPGKVSVHSKHRLAWQDMLDRGLQRALVVEDDGELINNFSALA